MNMAVDAAGGGDQILPRDYFGPRPDNQPRIDSRLDQRIASLADCDDSPVSNADVAFDNSPIIQNHRIGDHHIQRRLLNFSLQRRLPLAVSDNLPAAKPDFLA